jgi:Family of unknown function (DUF6155)
MANEIVDLFGKSDFVRDYYENKLKSGDSAEVCEKYKAIINNEFFPARGNGKARFSIARKAVTEYRKLAVSAFSTADLMLHYVEIGVEFTKTYGDIDGPFYDSMESMFASAAKFIVEHEIQDQFKERCLRIVQSASEFGWFFYEGLSYIYETHFDDVLSDA